MSIHVLLVVTCLCLMVVGISTPCNLAVRLAFGCACIPVIIAVSFILRCLRFSHCGSHLHRVLRFKEGPAGKPRGLDETVP